MGLPLRGDFRPPGDKSISHRALILAGLAHGPSVIGGLNPGADCNSTRRLMVALGALITEQSDGRLRVTGVDGRIGVPESELDAGNSGTTLRLLMGVAAAVPGTRRFTGDASLRRRPMDRVARPLEAMGARLTLTDGRFAPLSIDGGALVPVRYELPVASAQVKSALLLAGVLTGGTTVVVEPVPTRDHTERMLAAFGAPVRRTGPEVRVTGPARLEGCEVEVPGDLSAAAFTLVAALLVPGSRVTARGVGVNPTRRVVLDILRRMGAQIEEEATTGPRDPEPMADITAGFSELTAVDIGGGEAAVAIDELPILAVAAACAEGVTRVRDAAELRVKESDRIATMVAALRVLGVSVQEHADGFDVVGGGAGFRFRGGAVRAQDDHRVAMALAVAGMRATTQVTIDGMASAGISDPGFSGTIAALRGPAGEAGRPGAGSTGSGASGGGNG